MVLIVEALTEDFVERFWQFIKDGKYRIKLKSNGKPQFYRFDKSEDRSYPTMVELFSRKDGILVDNQTCGPIHVLDEISSLSAILLNDLYYELLLQGRTVINSISVLKEEYLILFKAKAFLDLTYRKENGESIKSEDIKKHRKDIIRLATMISPDIKVILNAEVKKDIQDFISKLKNDPIEPTLLGIHGYRIEDILNILENLYI